MGRYHGRVQDQFFYGYSESVEGGNKVDVRWIAMRDQSGRGLLITGTPSLSVNAICHTTEDLESHSHPFQLPVQDFVVFNGDAKQQGVGGDNS